MCLHSARVNVMSKRPGMASPVVTTLDCDEATANIESLLALNIHVFTFAFPAVLNTVGHFTSTAAKP